MLTSNVYLYLTVSCYFHSAQGLFELPLDITAATEVLGRVTGQIVAGNDSEFDDIFNFFVNLTQLENECRENVDRLTTTNSTGDDDDAAWETAINDALNEENITTVFNQTLKDEVIEYIETFVSKPENLKLTYLQSLPNPRKYIEDDVDIDDSEEANTEYNPFWDVTLTRRIFRGKRTKIKLFPFIASVHIFDEFACAGSIIKSDLVITAASCLQLAHNNRFFRENPTFIFIRVGSPFFKVGGDVIPVMEVYFHPTYEPRTLVNNLAIMRLRRLLNFRHRKVKKIDFDRSPSALPENTPGITIVGWGAKTESNKLTKQMRLHAAELDYYDTESCKEIYGKKYVRRTNFCAGYITKGEGACNRDVGDPGLSGRYLVGVTSFGSPSCGKVDTPTVFTKLGYYVDWIEEIMELDVPRMSKSTTTGRPFYLFDKPVKLYGGEGEHIPIPPSLLRELQGIENDTDQDSDSKSTDDDENTAMMPNEPGVQESKTQINEGIGTAQIVEIDPDVDADPEILVTGPDTEKLRIQPPSLIESGNMLQNYDQSDENGEDGSPMIPIERTTSIIDFEPTQQDIDIDIEVESVARTLKPPEVKVESASMLDLVDSPNIADSTMKPVTGMGNVEPEETISDFNIETDENTTDKVANTSKTENQDVWVDHEDYTALRKKKPDISPVEPQVEVTNLPSQVENQTEPIKYSINANINTNVNSVELGAVLEKIEDIDRNLLDEHHSSSENELEIQPDQPPSNFQEEITDDMVKLEIQKLITQLEISSELTSVTEDRRETNNTPLRNLVDDVVKGEDKSSDTVLTFLYLTDNEKQIHQRASDTSEDEGLSIDSAPFQSNTQVQHENDFVGKSEIYEIFANVMDTVNNTKE